MVELLSYARFIRRSTLLQEPSAREEGDLSVVLPVFTAHGQFEVAGKHMYNYTIKS